MPATTTTASEFATTTPDHAHSPSQDERNNELLQALTAASGVLTPQSTTAVAQPAAMHETPNQQPHPPEEPTVIQQQPIIQQQTTVQQQQVVQQQPVSHHQAPPQALAPTPTPNHPAALAATAGGAPPSSDAVSFHSILLS